MATSHRVGRVRASLLKEFSQIVRGLKDPRVSFVTVVDAEVSADLRHAKMYVSAMGSEEERRGATEALQKATGYIRREVARRLPMRHVPEITVAYDDTSENADRLTALIDRASALSATAARPDEEDA